jgi:hypothetical protein
MRNTIKKILKEDFEWAEEPLDLPLDDVEKWCDDNRNTLSNFIQRLEQTLSKLPEVDWNDRDNLSKTETQRALGVKQIIGDLRNIYESLNEIDVEIQEWKNPN